MELLKLIEESRPHRIVKLLYNCEATNDYSEKNMLKYLTDNPNLNKPIKI